MEYEQQFRENQSPKYECLLFDLDDTLYPLSSGLAAEVLKNIQAYMSEKLGIEESQVPILSNLLYKHYGTTMAGLRAIGYEFDYDDYHSFVHGQLPYEKLKPDFVLKHLLQSLPIRKVLFTNGDEKHAERALARLGLTECFEGVICFETLNRQELSGTGEREIFDIIGHQSSPNSVIQLPETPILCKPSVSAMEYALKIADIDPKKTVFFDDSVRNIQAGKEIGLHTVLVGTSQKVKGADHALESIHNIKEALPELWEEAEKSGSVRYSGKLAAETPVTA